ncbi:MAG TPA: hypothetical protein VGM27_25415 [Acidobacteriaceae bacterium]
MKSIAIYWIAALMANPILAVGQNNPQPVKGMASTVGLYVYPKNHQSANQQLTDESQCYTDAKSQTGFDPNAAAPATATKAQSEKGGDKSMAQGAARGAVISGATGGDPAAGARRGAIIGGIKSKRKQKQETAQADKQADADKTQQQQLDNFKRSLSSCLDSRNYSVK